MSSIPSTTASLYSGSSPSKPDHSMTGPKQNSASLRTSRLNSFLSEPAFNGNRLAALAAHESASSSSSAAYCPQKESVREARASNTQASKDEQKDGQLAEPPTDNNVTSSDTV